MKRLTLTICAAAVLLYACNNDAKTESATDSSKATTSETTKKEEAWVPVDNAKAMQDMMAAGTPGKMHEMLASWSGTWEGDMQMWMGKDSAAMSTKAKAVSKMVMGNRYQESVHTGTLPWGPFEGHGTMAYDNTNQQFVSTWIDNMSTQVMILKGNWDEGSKTLTLTGTVTDPSRKKECNIRETLKVIDANNQVMEMYGPDNATGKEYKMMEIKMTKKK
jgi:hypothetical protein